MGKRKPEFVTCKICLDELKPATFRSRAFAFWLRSISTIFANWEKWSSAEMPTMPLASVPTKEAVRVYMERRAHDDEPPSTPEEIRRQLGWDLLEAERKKQIERY